MLYIRFFCTLPRSWLDGWLDVISVRRYSLIGAIGYLILASATVMCDSNFVTCLGLLCLILYISALVMRR